VHFVSITFGEQGMSPKEHGKTLPGQRAQSSPPQTEQAKTDQPQTPLPLVYSCSGCSNIAQLANQLAIELDRDNIAEMSCIAGVGGGVKKLVKLAQSGRPIIALDGCALHCVKHCLARENVSPTHHFTLSEYGLKKHYKTDYLENELSHAKENVLQSLLVHSSK
jgi:uncharacterized metal-binding protein